LEITMANDLPIDTSKFRPIALSGARPGAAFAELADGTSRFVPGQQGVDRDSGLPAWEIDCAVAADADDERGRATNFTVKLASQHAPQVTPLQPITFVDLVARPAVNKKTGQVVCYWSAAGVASAVAPAKTPFGGATDKPADGKAA
jgi:hypothetical protein